MVNKMKKKLFNQVWHPVLFAIYSILALYTSNLGEAQFQSLVRSFVLVVLFSIILLGFCQILFKDWNQAGLMATWSLIIFLAYGHLYNFLKGMSWTVSLARHRVLLPIWLILFLGGSFLFVKKVKIGDQITRILNAVMGALVLFSLIPLGRHAVAQGIADRSYKPSETALGLTRPQDPPDIYYILLDGYTRADVLEAQFGFDNREFLDSLEALGFYIADCSRSNYAHTHLTLPSLMNMAYIDTLASQLPQGATVDSLRFDDLTKDNRVMQSLEGIGYETIAFETSYYWAQFSEVDIYFEPTQTHFLSPSITDFEEIYLETTLLSALLDWAAKQDLNLIQAAVMPKEAHALRIRFTLDKLKALPELEGPQFVMVHLVVPHPPYIFNQEGVIPNLDDYDKLWEEGQRGQAGYLNNIRYINREILQVVSEILETSSTPPVIILQADHGSNFYDRTMILSAFHLPGSGSQALYSHITPVNTFRLVFKEIFDAPYELLPDQTFSGKYPPFDFQPIEETYPHCLSNE